MAALLPVRLPQVGYDEDAESLGNFLRGYKETITSEMGEEESYLKYDVMIQNVVDKERTVITIDLNDIFKFEDSSERLVAKITGNTRHYVDLACEVIDKIIKEKTPTNPDVTYKDSVLDVIIQQRSVRDTNRTLDTDEPFPPSLTRRYEVFFKPMTRGEPYSIREVNGGKLGHLVTVRGIITRVSDVRPLLQVNTYSCDSCGYEIFQEIKQRQFTPLTECASPECARNGVRGRLYMQTRASKFLAFQEVKMQELTDQVPVGHIPRTMSLHMYGAACRQLTPGDVASVSGIFVPMPYTGFRALRAGLLTDTYLDVQYVERLKKQYDEIELTQDDEAALEQMKRDPNIYTRLARSIAPEIYGHDDVKKALLLLMVGGVNKTVGDGMKIRGDINICLMGDPGVAKSQMLKFIAKVAPRGVYTTGRGSSGVGLTAAVIRDPSTDEMILEGGALVLADNGICCIDEFDKMDESDRTAIHEVMEQQTISISKAGINTTLNARASILAAANPLYGRYNTRISPTQNINLPAALLSRFDILYLLLDKPTDDMDRLLAEHVTYVHTHNKAPKMDFQPLEPHMIRHYVAHARTKRPVLTNDVSEYITTAYVSLRRQYKMDEDREKQFTYASARTLLGIIRMSQAIARIRLSDIVETKDVDEALRIIDVSKSSLIDDSQRRDGQQDRTPLTAIYNIVKELTYEYGRSIALSVIRQRVAARGYSEAQLEEVLREYAGLDIWQVNQTHLTFIQ